MKIEKKYVKGVSDLCIDYAELAGWFTSGFNDLQMDCGSDYFKIAGKKFFETPRMKEEILRMRCKCEAETYLRRWKEEIQEYLRELKAHEAAASWILNLE